MAFFKILKMDELELFKEMLNDNQVEVAELLRQHSIIYDKGDELNACYEAYKRHGESFSYALSKIFAENSKTSNYDTGINEAFGLNTLDNPFATNKPPSSVTSTPNTTTTTTNETTKNTNTGGRFQSIFSTVTNVLNTGIGLFASFQTAKGQKDALMWEKQKEYYDRQNKDKASRNILIIAVLLIIAIVAVIVLRKK